MSNFLDKVNDSFFLYTSLDHSVIEEKLYGFCYYNDSVISNCEIEDYDFSEPRSGYYVAVKYTNKDEITVFQDAANTMRIYYYLENDIWAISNSFWDLCERLATFSSVNLDDVYAEQYMSFGVTPLSLTRTLCEKIKVIECTKNVVINLNSNTISFKDNYCCKKGVSWGTYESFTRIDEWARRWSSIICKIISDGYTIKVDLSGGFDSRISLALLIDSGIDLSSEQVYIYSNSKKKEDWNIATMIAKHFGFELMDSYVVPGGKEISGRDAFEIYRKLLSPVHREPYMNAYYYDKPIFYLNGISGEIIRGWKQIDSFLTSFHFPIGRTALKRYPTSSWIELICDWHNYPVLSQDEEISEYEKNRYLFLDVRNRTHMGVVIFQNYFSNLIQLTCFNDPLILSLGIADGQQPIYAFGYILAILCPDLLCFPVSDKRSFSNELIDRVKKDVFNYKRIKRKKTIEGIFNKIVNSSIEMSPCNKKSGLDYLEEWYNDGSVVFFKEHFKSFGNLLCEEALDNRNDNSLNFKYQYIATIAAIGHMLKLEHQSNRYNGDNYLIQDYYKLKSFYKNNKTFTYLHKQLHDIGKCVFEKLTLRIDMVFHNEQGEGFTLEDFSDEFYELYGMNWLKEEFGMIIQSYQTRIGFSILTKCDGHISVNLRTKDSKTLHNQENEYCIELVNVTCDDTIILNAPTRVSYSLPWSFDVEVQANCGRKMFFEWRLMEKDFIRP